MRVCPACRGVARSKPLPPEGFWQVQILQRIGMYPYRCEACGVRFFRRVEVGDVAKSPPRHYPIERSVHPLPGGQVPSARENGPRVVPPPEGIADDGLTHEDFVDLIDHISRSEQRKGLKAPGEDPEDD